MEQYNVTGMSCAACQTRVEKAVSKVPGVTSCAVSLLTNSMGVEGTASPAEIIAAVENAGYGASKKGEKGSTSQSASTAEYEEMLKDKETPVMKRRLVSSVLLLIPLMYFSMGHMMWGWPLPKFFEGNHIAMGLVQLLLTIAVMVINQKFFISGFKSLWHRAPNMDTLVALGSMASFLWSVYVLFAMTRAQVDGDSAAVMNYMMDFYFESAAMILTLITVLVLLVFGSTLQKAAIRYVPIISHFMSVLIGIRIIIIMGVLIFFFAWIFKMVPNRKASFKSQLPGAILSAVSWYVFSFGLSIYVEYFNGFSTYGSLATIVLVMLWLYFCMYILLLCAETNVVFSDLFHKWRAKLHEKRVGDKK